MMLFLYIVGAVITFCVCAHLFDHDDSLFDAVGAFLLLSITGLLWPIVLPLTPVFLLFRKLRYRRIQKRKEENEIEDMLTEGPDL